MQIDIMSFTRRGIELSAKIRDKILGEQEDYEVCLYTKYGKYQNLTGAERDTWNKQEQNAAGWKNPVYVKETIYEWMRTRFEHNRNGQKTGVIWIGACGIAVRAMAPSLRDKLTDIPVLVVDEAGQFVIPVLSGHYGGANELAGLLAKRIGATPVITTATDVNHAFAVDVFAKENGLWIQNKEKIAEVSSKILDGKKIAIMTDGRVEGKIPESVCIYDKTRCGKTDVVISARYPVKNIPVSQIADSLWLIPRMIILGMGCKRGKSCGEIEQFVLEILEQEQISIQAVTALATIDLKKEEQGILSLSHDWQIPFRTYTENELKQVPGEFTPSPFVKKITGVDNVCERSAVFASGNGSLLQKKNGENGVTTAVAAREWRIHFE